METLINIISHNLTGGIGIGLFVGSLLNWYTIKYYDIKIKRANRNAHAALMIEQNEIALIKTHKGYGFDCDYCGRFSPMVNVQRKNMHVACSYKHDEEVNEREIRKEAAFQYMINKDGRRK